MGGLFCYTYLKDGRRFTPASFWCAQNEFKTCGFAAVFFVSMYSLKQAWLVQKTKKPRNDVVLNSFGGERGIRTPGPVTVNSFQDYRNRPLCHLSAANVGREKQFCKKMPNLFMNSMVLIT